MLYEINFRSSNLEVPGHAVSAPKNKSERFRHFFFFLSLFNLFIYLSKLLYGDKKSQTTKARNLIYEDVISLYMKLCTCIFGGTTSRGLRHMHPNFVTAKCNK